jgi:hypothetical protein
MNRRNLIKTAMSLPLLSSGFSPVFPESESRKPHNFASRARPSDPTWPSPKSWEKLRQAVGGRLLKPELPFAVCQAAPESDACREALQQLKNPFYIGDQVAMTQISGWTDAWVSQPSAYAVAARNTAISLGSGDCNGGRSRAHCQPRFERRFVLGHQRGRRRHIRSGHPINP